ncbi:MAG: tetratricopeptide repeat protein [Bacteroidales bacterium]|jgi:tetratricopeptide (TPR) repeat protein|nr:tetratricopeptide repeat protein [Bacteroidales bacterium]MDY0197812.1 tetratricopeptide repeat protein [Tenuifilaceae bacterium]
MELLKHSRLIITVLLITALQTNTFSQDNITAAFKESYVLEQKGEYAKASEKLNKVYLADSYELNLRLGWLNYLAGKLNESESYYGKAISLKPYSIESRLGMAYPLSAQAKWDELVALYNKILEIDPQNSLVNYRLGLIYYNRGNYEYADKYLDKVINLYPFDYDTMILLAWNKFALQKFKEAKVLFNKVLMHTPDDASALEGLRRIK